MHSRSNTHKQWTKYLQIIDKIPLNRRQSNTKTVAPRLVNKNTDFDPPIPIEETGKRTIENGYDSAPGGRNLGSTDRTGKVAKVNGGRITGAAFMSAE